MKLGNPFFSLTIDPQSNSYSIIPSDSSSISLRNIPYEIMFEDDQTKIVSRLLRDSVSIGEIRTEITRFGRVQWVNFAHSTSIANISAEMTFAVMEETPMVLMRMTLINKSSYPVTIKKFSFADESQGSLAFGSDESQPAFFSNGWQSWSSSRAYQVDETQDRSRLGVMQQPMVINSGTPIFRKPGHFSSDMFGVIADHISRKGLLAGFLSQKKQFGTITTNLTGEIKISLWANGDDTLIPPGESMSTDWACLLLVDLDQIDPMRVYLDAVNLENLVKPPKSVPLGWCSWYYFYTKVSAKDIRSNLDALVKMQDELPLSLLQIDDGFEHKVGDWLKFNDKFPDGVRPLSEEIKDAGLIPGLWLAPYIVQPQSDLVKEHPDWLLRDSAGRQVKAGFGWNSMTSGLDLTNPEALAYTIDVIKTATKEWGYPYLKLDFLYAAALPGKYQDPTKTRAQVLRHGLETIREAAGDDTALLACGCPLGSALGLFDIMRISADVSGSWEPEFLGISSLFKTEPHMPSAKNAIKNILNRTYMDKLWWTNDPDCLLIRPDTKLTLEEVRSLTSAIAMTGGSMLLSDDLPLLPQDRLDIAKLIVPVIDQRVQVLDWMEKPMPERLKLDFENVSGPWYLLAQFNWSEAEKKFNFSPKDWGLADCPYLSRELWTGKIYTNDRPFVSQIIPPHGVRILALRQKIEYIPQYLGSSLHFSQGLEVSSWSFKKRKLNFTLSLPRKTTGEIFLSVPSTPMQVTQDGEEISFAEIRPNVVAIRLSFNQHTKLSLTLQNKI